MDHLRNNLYQDQSSSADVLERLKLVCNEHGLDSLSERLIRLRSFLANDFDAIDKALSSAASGESLAEKSAQYLLNQDGKRLRPMCVALAASVGKGVTDAARTYAVAVELVHSATLLHDDVVDLGDRRRGVDTARVVYGNAASIFGGDFLLVDALHRIQSARVEGVLDQMLIVLKEMVVAESLQLARRGRIHASKEEYFRIIEGKTASLFRWAAYAGARAGELDDVATSALAQYGQNLGVAFQIADDMLDVMGDPTLTGKELLSDLREGKMTYPFIIAIDKDPSLAQFLEELCADVSQGISVASAAKIKEILADTNAVEISVQTAMKFAQEAAQCLDVLPQNQACSALRQLALLTPQRRK